MTLQLTAQAARAALTGVIDGTVAADDDAVLLRWARAVWSCLCEPGDGIAGALVSGAGPVRALEIALATRGALAEAAELGISDDQLAAARRRWHPRVADVGAGLQAARRAGVALVTPHDQAWPARVDDLGAHAPHCFWVRGDLSRLTPWMPSVAIVGARAATGYGEHVAGELAADLAASGIAVVSGAAYGIDGAAHRAALAAGGITVALLAGGVERPYPAGNADLLRRIGEHGAAASEVPCGSVPTKWRFLQRNRTIAALADAVVIVEAGWRSGSLNTASHAETIGRPLGAVPGPITSATSAGCHRLLRESDVRCITTADDVRELLGLRVAPAPAQEGYTDDSTRVLDALSTRTPRATEDVARRSGMSPDAVRAVLGLLELDGVVVRLAAGWRRMPRA